MIVKALNLLKESKHSLQQLGLKVNYPLDQLRLLLEWGEAQKLWLKDSVSQAYMISDTGELILEMLMVKDMLKVHPLKLDKPEFDHLLKKLKHVQLCLRSLQTP